MASTIADRREPSQFEPSTEPALPKAPLILLMGSYQPELHDSVRSICSRVLVPISNESGALIADDGQLTGPARAMGSAAADSDNAPRLLAIVPDGTPPANIEPNHSTVIPLPKESADTVKSRFDLLDRLLSDAGMAGRAAALLFGGNDDDKRAVIRCARRQWPVVVFGDTGGLAGAISAQLAVGQPKSSTAVTNPDLREIIETATIYLFRLDSGMEDVSYPILVSIEPRPETAKETLKVAADLFHQLDDAASRRQTWFRRIETWLVALAVIASVLAVVTTIWPWNPSPPGGHPNWLSAGFGLHVALLIVPISISILGAYNSHFRDGIKWILLRGSAETLKREIYRFRARSGDYADEKCRQTSREIKLAAKVKDIYASLQQSEVNKQGIAMAKPEASSVPQTWGSSLSPDEYVSERLQDQIHFFETKTRKLSRQLKRMQILIYLAGGGGTFLAAMNRDLWVAVATAFVAAFTTKLQADQVETSLVNYNQTLASLRAIECWWNALSPWEKNRPANRDVLVEQTEKALEKENVGWLQQMQTALEKLTEKEPAAANK